MKAIRTVFTILFLACLGCGMVYSCTPNLVRQMYSSLLCAWPTKESVATVEATYNGKFMNGLSLNAFGLSQRILQKREVRNFEVLKDQKGVLYLGSSSSGEPVDVTPTVRSICALYEKAKLNSSDFLFVQTPYKDSSCSPDLKNYDASSLYSEFDCTLDALLSNGIPCIDLRQFPKTTQTLKTDHHWTPEAAFHAARIVADQVLKEQTPPMLSDETNYSSQTYPNAMLGSIGIKIGAKYAGKDDFTILIPNFATQLNHLHLIDHSVDAAHAGDFTEAFLDTDVLENPNYQNKYNACLHGGYVENIITNDKAANDVKVLFIAHSYGRPMAMYLSLYFRETRYLDPQAGRYRDSYLEYMDKYRPDIVIVMYNDEIPL